MSLSSTLPTIDPGEFRHKISLLIQVIGQNASGAALSYQPANPPVTARVKIEYVRGDEKIKSGQDISQMFLKVTGWFRPQFTVGARIQTASGAQYIIQNVENVRELNTYMVLHCIAFGVNP